tara:strand:+ start:223 stop:519 length:297 start_codon:yes stop_codon:yes gene_type:complete
MPGGSKKGGGLEVGSAYKMKYNKSSFPFKSENKEEEEHFLVKKKKMPQEGMVPHMGYVHTGKKTKDNPSGGVDVQLGWKDPREGKDAYHYFEKPKKKK